LRYTALYPLLFASTRVMYVAAHNPGQFSIGDLVIVLAFTLTLVALMYAVATLLFRGRAQGMLPALVTFVVLAWVFGAPPIEEWLTRSEIQVPPVILGIVSAGGSGVLILGLVRRPHALRIGETFLTLTYSLLVLYLGAGIVANWMRAQEQVNNSRLAAELTKPLQAARPGGTVHRDVYVIVLDEYDNAATLRDVLGYDNRKFEDSLRALGFHIPLSVRSNYASTYLSLPSFLNASHVTRVEGELPPGSNDPTLLNHIVARSRVARFVQEQGYRFVFFPSAWWNSTRTSPMADSVVQVLPAFSLGRELSRTEFRRVIRRNTITWRFYAQAEGDDAIVRSTLEEIGRLPSVPGPVFAFAHIMSPHPPHSFDRACGTRPTEWRRDPVSYLADLECLNKLLLATVSRLIRDSEVPPVIVLQGDHGSTFRRFTDIPKLAQVSAAAARERLGAFGAYYLPAGGAEAFGDSVTVVNVLGHILRHYFGADMPLEPDDLFLSLIRAPFEFRRINPRWLAGENSVPRAAAAERTLH
jgi:hypothetical protein